ncbi:hypothetical protein DFP72DRAFT_854843 [Ephemerocybe angulata]|uniref:Uncharacterized protein n=1 Tax=Ephemerocybe angulata TaxID=980116 RepID=A0A8H6HHA8_9AGAR|nr:hypothetical protein DFP72DRAFT_854843 [Tulosesus angulatus]
MVLWEFQLSTSGGTKASEGYKIELCLKTVSFFPSLTHLDFLRVRFPRPKYRSPHPRSISSDSETNFAPELGWTYTTASTGKKVLVLYAPPPRTSQSHPMNTAEKNMVKFTEGTEANKMAPPIPDEAIIDPSPTSSKKKARVIKPLPKRSLRQSARLTARVEVARLAPQADSAPPAGKGKAQIKENDENDERSGRPKATWRIVRFAEDA